MLKINLTNAQNVGEVRSAVLLKRHILTHIRDRKNQLKCKHGPSDVRHPDNIFEHIHVGTHPYACNMCDKKFKGLPGLEKHILSHTSTKSKAQSQNNYGFLICNSQKCYAAVL